MNIYKRRPTQLCCSEQLNYRTNIYASNGPFSFLLLLQIRTKHNSKIVRVCVCVSLNVY